jgi:hypothetical protein
VVADSQKFDEKQGPDPDSHCGRLENRTAIHCLERYGNTEIIPSG